MGHYDIFAEAENISKSPFTLLYCFYFKSQFKKHFLKSFSLGKAISVLNTQVTVHY